MRVRVVTINVWNLEGDPRRQQILNQLLRGLDPDLIALTEVVRTPARNQLDDLVAGLNLHTTHQDDIMAPMPSGDRYGGTAVATRWPHRVVEALDTRSADAPDVPWATLAASVAIPTEGELLFIAAASAWRLDAEAARERQAVALSDLDARHRTALPTVVAGDLNAAPEAASVRYLTGQQSLAGRSVSYQDAWAVAGDGPGYTWTADNPNAAAVIDEIVGQPNHYRRIDYVLIGARRAHPTGRATICRAALAFNEPVDGIWASDHFGLVVDLEIGTET